MCVYSYDDITSNESILASLRLKDKITVSCSRCQVNFTSSKKNLLSKLKSHNNIYCTECVIHLRFKDSYKFLNCTKCNTEIKVHMSTIKNSKTGRFFCSHSCAASITGLGRIVSSSTRERMSILAKEQHFHSTFPKRIPSARKEYHCTCIVCEKEFTNKHPRKTCSTECLTTRRSNHSLSLNNHGGGKRGIYNGFNCDSTYELAFLIYHLDHDIPITRCNEIRSYVYENSTCNYNPDFIVDGKIYEIKGFMSNRSKAKLSCNPDIVLIDGDAIKPFISYVKDKYRVSDIADLYQTKLFKQSSCNFCKVSYTRKYATQKFCSISCGAKNRKYWCG